jgi:hypothetical protein
MMEWFIANGRGGKRRWHILANREPFDEPYGKGTLIHAPNNHAGYIEETGDCKIIEQATPPGLLCQKCLWVWNQQLDVFNEGE